MVLKTFNVNEEVYNKFSRFCKEHGISMSKQIELFMESMVEEEPEAKKEYLEKLERIRKGKFLRIKSLAERYGLQR
ncbi:hypothetical protein DRJ16_01255 [Candidatus Woesearchaeota archaeon]|nr:MAG: hypothetical protein DRJ16_01255 [Candidatus Woesearchaeota archaeon]